MSLNLPICHACNTILSRKQRTTITKNVTNPPYLGAQLKKCDHIPNTLLHNFNRVQKIIIKKIIKNNNNNKKEHYINEAFSNTN